MPAPRYDVRAGWLSGDWTEIGSKYTWDQVTGNFRWEELQAGPMPGEDIEELQISRKIGTIYERLSTGECRVQMDNTRGQYTGTKSLQNLVPWSDDISSGTVWLTSNANTSLNMLTGKTGAIDADTLADDSTNATHSLRAPNIITISSGQNITVSAEFFPGTRDRIQLRCYDQIESHVFAASFSIRSLTAAQNQSVVSGQLLAASHQLLSDGWVRCTIVGNIPTDNGTLAGIRMYMINSAGQTSYAGTSAWIGVRAVQASVGTGAIAFVPTTNSLAVFPRDTNLTVNDVFAVKAVDGSSVFNIFSGYLDEWAFNPAMQDLRKIAISCSDVANRLRPIISTSLMVAPTHTKMIQAIMSAAAIDPLQWRGDQINDIAAYAIIDQVSAGQALSDIQQNGAELYYVDGAGRLNVKARHYDVYSTLAVGSYSQVFQLVQNLSTDQILNKVEVRTVPRRIFPDVSTVAWLNDAILVPAASSKQFVLDFYDALTNETGVPVYNIQAQVLGDDIRAFQDPEGLGPEITSQFSVVASLNSTSAAFSVSNNGAGNGYLVVCQLKGQAVTKQPELAKTLKDDTSIAQYQERFASIQADMLFTENRARNLAEFMLVDSSQPKQLITLTLKNEWPGCFQHELLDRVFVGNSLCNISSVFVVEELEHTVTLQGGLEHALQMKLRVAPIKNWFTLDSSTLGRLNYNQLGF